MYYRKVWVSEYEGRNIEMENYLKKEINREWNETNNYFKYLIKNKSIIIIELLEEKYRLKSLKYIWGIMEQPI